MTEEWVERYRNNAASSRRMAEMCSDVTASYKFWDDALRYELLAEQAEAAAMERA